MKRIIFLFIFLIVDYALAETVTVKDYLELLLQSDVEYERIVKDLEKKNYVVNAGLPTKEFLLDVQNEYGIVLGDGQTTSTLGTSLSKEFVQSGTRASAYFNKNKQIGRDEKTTGVRIEQPVLFNAFGSTSRLTKNKLTQEEEIIYLQVVQAFEDYVEKKVQEYLDLQLDYVKLQAAYELEKQAKVLEKNILEKNKSNIARSLDVDRITLQRLEAQESVLQTQTSFEDKLRAIGQVIGRSLPPDVVITEVQNFESDVQTIPSLVQSSRTLEIAKKQTLILKDQALLQKRGLVPELDLVLGFNRDESTRFNVSADRNEFVIGFDASLPLGDSQGKALLKTASLEASIAQMDEMLLQRNIEIELATLRSQIEKQRKSVDIAKEKSKLSERIAKEEIKRYNRGQIDIEQLVDAQYQRAQHQFAMIESSVTLSKLIFQWKNRTDQLLKKEDIARLQ
ncbi:MAG: TolC family protein [Bdellovibrionales bacterium]|nr:TolC family protein [Bdellovibrionales bacterium]